MAGEVEVKINEPDPQRDLPRSAESIRNELEKILNSRTFRPAQGQRSFLQYAVEEAVAGRGHLLKEYLIGTEAFGRGEAFDPRLDPIVRTQARKLRARLAKYYETEGAGDPLRIEFRKGSYVPSFRKAEAETPAAVTLSTALPKAPVVAAVPAAVRLEHFWKMAAISLALLLLVVSGCGVFYLYSSSRASPSIAVMPFVNLGDSQGHDEFLSDGLSEEVIDLLGQVPGLQVAARTSAFRFKGTTLNIREIGDRLHVRTVLIGSIRKSAHRLYAAVQLNSLSGNRLWSGSYDRESNDARTIPQEIARAVINVLGQDSARMFSNQASPSPGAHNDYLKGLYFWNKLNAGSLNTATQYFEQAIGEDPSFARAYAALADCYVMGPQVATTPPLQAIPRIKAGASEALALDGALGEAHIDLAIGAEYEFDWATAEKEFKKGLALSPGSAVGHLWYAKYLALVGRRDEVLAQRRIAAELDPVSPYAVQSIGGYFSVMGRYDDAIEQFRSALALEPNFGLTRQGLGVAYLLKGMSAEGIAELQAACKLMEGPRRLALLGWAYGVTGKTAEARRILSGFLDQSGREPFPALAIADVYIGLGDKDRAFEWLAKAVEQRDLSLDLKWDSFYESLRSDPRYIALLRRQKLS